MEGAMFPFILMTDSKTSAGLSMNDVPEHLSHRNMVALFDSWQTHAARMVATNNDRYGNAATFLKPGNFDEIGARIDAWSRCPIFVYMDESYSTVLGFMLMSDNLLRDGSQFCCTILAAAVNPFYYNKGFGKRMILNWIGYQKKENEALPAIPSKERGSWRFFPKIDSVVLLSEQTSLAFWKKIGFNEWDTTKFNHFDDLTPMILCLC